MKDRFYGELEKERRELKLKIEQLESSADNFDGYYLEIKKNKGRYTQYYKCKRWQEPNEKGSNKVNRTFIKKSDWDVAKNLAQSDYNKQLLKDLKVRYRLLQPVTDYYMLNSKDKIYANLTNDRKCLIETDYVDDETYINRWKDKYRKSSNENDTFYKNYPITRPYYTENGEQVRSKSEKIIADKLSRECIPYVYEPSVHIGNKVFHPDFVVLNINERKTYYYEHFGMMDNPEYSSKFVNKIKMYAENGFEYGRNLLYTFETQAEGLDTSQLERMIMLYF